MTGELFFSLNYSDDFAGAEAAFDRANLAFTSLGQLLVDINLVESTEKACAPAKIMTYLGVSFNTIDMCMHVDSDKVSELKLVLVTWVRKTVAKKQELQSVLGKLLWVSRAVRFSRAFVGRIIAEIRKLEKQSDKTILSVEIRKDFLWWHTFLEKFSGVEIIPPPSANISIYGDACVQGGGAWNPCATEYFSTRFPYDLCSPSTPIHVKEFLILIQSVKVWGKSLVGQRVNFFCDNDAVCDTVSLQKPKDAMMQKLLREFFYWVCRFNIHPIVCKISSKDNYVADFVSRVYDIPSIEKFFSSNGYPFQSKINILESSFEFVADW